MIVFISQYKLFCNYRPSSYRFHAQSKRICKYFAYPPINSSRLTRNAIVRLKLNFTFRLARTRQVCFAHRKSDSLNNAFKIGDVDVLAPENNNHVGAPQTNRSSKNDVAGAGNMLSVIILFCVGARTKLAAYLRGTYQRKISLFFDGKGMVVLGCFTTLDIADIQRSKLYTSALYGPNTLGGTINLIRKKPIKKPDVQWATGTLNICHKTYINTGRKYKNFYIQPPYSPLKRDSYPISKDYENTEFENGGINNTFDKKYALTEDYYEPRRMYHTNRLYKF